MRNPSARREARNRDASMRLRLRMLTPLLAALVAMIGCATSPDAPGESDLGTVAAGETRAQRLLALDIAIEADYNRLLELIFEPTTATSIPLRTNPELLEIAERLPPMQAERQRLENQVTDEASEEEKQP